MNNKQHFNEFSLEDRTKLMQARLDDCGGDFKKYLEKYNRHTLKVSLINEQVNKEVWEGSDITFFNEDNAINHLSLLGDFLDFLTKDENKFWGTGRADEALVQRATDFIRERVSPPEGFNAGDLKPITELVEDLKKAKEEKDK